jgi:hypothetical protein
MPTKYAKAVYPPPKTQCTECIICLQAFQKGDIVVACSSCSSLASSYSAYTHIACWLQWTSQTCFLCGSTLVLQELSPPIRKVPSCFLIILIVILQIITTVMWLTALSYMMLTIPTVFAAKFTLLFQLIFASGADFWLRRTDGIAIGENSYRLNSVVLVLQGVTLAFMYFWWCDYCQAVSLPTFSNCTFKTRAMSLTFQLKVFEVSLHLYWHFFAGLHSLHTRIKK